LALVAIAIFSGPWLFANRQAYGKLLYNTEVHATCYWKHEQGGAVLKQFSSPPADDPPIHLSWSDYYLDYLGPLESAKRFTTGYPKLAVKLVASQVVPRGAAGGTLGSSQDSAAWRLVVVALAVSFALLLALVALRLRRTGKLAALTWESTAILALAIAPYAALANAVEMRVLVFAVPMLALAVGIITDRLLTTTRVAGEAPITPTAPTAHAL
jgi:hypothetical protein